MRYQDIELHIAGEGKSMLLLHGWGMDATMLEPLFLHFSKTYRVCSLDLPGFGKSEEPPYPYSIYDYVNVVKTIVRDFSLEDPIIIAHSFGARIAFRYAALFPVSFLIISGGAGIKPPRNFAYYMQIAWYKTLRFLHIQNQLGSKDYRNASLIMRSTLVKAVNDDVSDAIQEIEAPILLVWGDKDEQTPLWMAEKICRLNENASLVVFKNDDHFACFHQMNRFINVCEAALKGGK